MEQQYHLDNADGAQFYGAFLSGFVGGAFGAGLIWLGFVKSRASYVLAKRRILSLVVVPALIGGTVLQVAVLASPPGLFWPEGDAVSFVIHLPWQTYLGFALCRAMERSQAGQAGSKA